MKIIAIGHYARVGKDSFADFLIHACQERSPKMKIAKVPWAWKLKLICYDLYGWAGLREPQFYDTPEGAALREVILPKLGKSPRQIWIDFGTRAVRDNVYPHTWRDYLLKSDHGLDVLIIPDTRFQNEIEGVDEAGGHKLKIVRPGFGPAKNRPDRELVGYRGWSNVIGEKGTLIDLKGWATVYAMWLCDGTPEPSRQQWEIDWALSHETIEPWSEFTVPELTPAEHHNACLKARADMERDVHFAVMRSA